MKHLMFGIAHLDSKPMQLLHIQGEALAVRCLMVSYDTILGFSSHMQPLKAVRPWNV